MKKTQGDGSGKKRHKSILLELILEDGGIRLSLWSNCKSLLSIGDGNVEARSSSSNRHRSNTDSSRKKSLGHLEKSAIKLLLHSCEFSILIDITEFVHHVFSWNSDIVKSQRGIVYTILSHLQAHVSDGHSWHLIEILVSNWHEETRYTFVFTLDNGLTKN